MTYIPRSEEDTLFYTFASHARLKLAKKKTGKSKSTTLSFPLSSKKGDMNIATNMLNRNYDMCLIIMMVIGIKPHLRNI